LAGKGSRVYSLWYIESQCVEFPVEFGSNERELAFQSPNVNLKLNIKLDQQKGREIRNQEHTCTLQISCCKELGKNPSITISIVDKT